MFHDQCTATTESGNCTRTGQIFSLAEVEQAIRIELGLSSTDIITSVDLTSEGRGGSGKVNGMSVSYDLDNLPPAAQPETPSSRSRGQGGGFNPGFWSGLYAGAVGVANSVVTVGSFGFANLDAAEDAAFRGAGLSEDTQRHSKIAANVGATATAALAIPGAIGRLGATQLGGAVAASRGGQLAGAILGNRATQLGFTALNGRNIVSNAANAVTSYADGDYTGAAESLGRAVESTIDTVNVSGKFGKTTRVKTAPKKVKPEVEVPEGTTLRSPKLGQQQGRQFRKDQLEVNEFDANQPKHVRGFLKNERRRINGPGGGPNATRTPPGYVQAHGRTTPAREGFDYTNSRLQGTDLNRLEERVRRREGRP